MTSFNIQASEVKNISFYSKIISSSILTAEAKAIVIIVQEII